MPSMVAELLVFAVFYLFLLALGVADYVLSSWAVYTIAKRRLIANPWLAWVPFASSWTLGCIAQDYDERNGIKRKWAKIMLGLVIAMVVAVVIVYIAFIIFFVYAMINNGGAIENAPIDEVRFVFILYFAAMIIAVPIANSYMVCAYICYYKLYESTVPEKALKYMILTVLIPIVGAICMFKCKDKGYSKPEFAEPVPLVEAPVEETIVNEEDTEE